MTGTQTFHNITCNTIIWHDAMCYKVLDRKFPFISKVQVFLDFVCPELNTENKNNFSTSNSYYSYHNYDKNTKNWVFFLQISF